jgi:DNA-binding transcriptional LysR family regulator
MNLHHLQALVGIADHGGFSAAAEAMGTVQSNISAHVAKLEKELGTPLVDRSTGKLTEEGAIVVARTRRMLIELDAMVADVAAMRQDVVGKVRAGMIGTTGRWLVPALFAYLRDRHPGVQMTVADGTSANLEPRVASGQLDFAVVALPVSGEELIATPLFDEDLMLVVRADHALASAPAPLPLSALTELELLLPLPNTALRDDIDGALRRAGVTLTPAIELDGIRMIASLTFDGYGPSILPATAVPIHMRSQFKLLPLEGLPRRQVGIALRRRGLPSAPTRAVIDLLNHHVAADVGRMPAGVHPSSPTRR